MNTFTHSTVRGQNTGTESRPLSPQSRIQTSYEPLKPVDLNPKKSNIVLDPYDMESQTVAKQLTPEQRYWFYVQNGIQQDSIAPIESCTISEIEKFVPGKLLEADYLQKSKHQILVEIEETYNQAVRQSIIDYILLDPTEQARLGISPFLDPYVPRIARAPVPWHADVIKAKEAIRDNLYITNPVMSELLGIFTQFEKCRIVDPSVFTPNVLPMSTEDFQTIFKNQCAAFRAKMLTEYVLQVN